MCVQVRIRHCMRNGSTQKKAYNFRIFYCVKKENSSIIEITSGNKFINCQNNPASYIYQMVQLLVYVLIFWG